MILFFIVVIQDLFLTFNVDCLALPNKPLRRSTPPGHKIPVTSRTRLIRQIFPQRWSIPETATTGKMGLQSGLKQDAVRIVEVGPRDGLQNISQRVPTSVKVALIQRLIKAGLSTVEATSCVSPKWVPQLADSKEVLTQIERHLESGSVALPVLVPNLQGLDAALRHNVKEVAVFVSASEGFSRKNTNCSVDEALERARQVVSKARQHNVAVRG